MGRTQSIESASLRESPHSSPQGPSADTPRVFDFLQTWHPVITVGIGFGGVVGTLLYRMKSVRQRQQLLDIQHELEARRTGCRVEVTHLAITEFAAYEPHILLVRVVARNFSDRSELVSSLSVQSEDGGTTARFEDEHRLEGNGLLTLETECWMNGGIPCKAVIRLADGSATHEVARERTSHGVFTGYAQPWVPRLAREETTDP